MIQLGASSEDFRLFTKFPEHTEPNNLLKIIRGAHQPRNCSFRSITLNSSVGSSLQKLLFNTRVILSRGSILR